MKEKIFEKIKVNSEFERGIVGEVLSDIYGELGEGGVVVDCGAHIGTFSIYAGLKNNKVYSFEPSSANYKTFLENIKIFNLEDKIIPYNLAVGKDGEAYLNLVQINTGGNFIFDEPVENNYEKVKIINLFDFLKDKEKEVNFLKIDIEGSEYDVIETFNFDEIKVKQIGMELHTYKVEEQKINNLLKKLENYFIINIDNNDRYLKILKGRIR